MSDIVNFMTNSVTPADAPTSRRVGPGRVQGASVDVVDVSKQFGSVRAVRNVSLTAKPGEFLSLLGPSGSGKTTILMSIAGFEQPSSGEIKIDDRSVTHVPSHRREVGMVFQRYALFPHMTVAENIEFPLRMRGLRSRDRADKVQAALAMVRLEEYGSRRPHQLSGGQQQRIALARATVYRPRVLLMDEPLGALDLKLREQMQLEIKQLQRQLGTTVIYVTHDQGEALTMSDRIAVIHNGRLQQLGAPEEIYDRPANAFVADFIGETNLLPGRIAPSSARTLVALDSQRSLVPVKLSRALAEGSRVTVSVRSERVVLKVANTDSGQADPNGWPVGQIEERVYTGSSVGYLVGLRSGDRVIVRIPVGVGSQAFSVGDSVEVSWGPDDAIAFSQDQSEEEREA